MMLAGRWFAGAAADHVAFKLPAYDFLAYCKCLMWVCSVDRVISNINAAGQTTSAHDLVVCGCRPRSCCEQKDPCR